MKRFFKILAIILTLTLFGSTVASCGEDQTGNKYEIVVEPFSGSGFGYQWLKDLATDWMKDNPDYTVKVKESSTYMAGDQLSQIAAGTTITDVYYGSDPNYSSGIYKGYFEDLTDMLSVKPDGENGLTIREKIMDFDNWQKVASKVSYDSATDKFSYSGCYMLPHSITMTGLVYDHDKFLEHGLLTYAPNTAEVKGQLSAQGITFDVSGSSLIFSSSTGSTNYKSGDRILIAGKDGKYGTYDDGQPQTMADFDEMVKNIVAMDAANKAFVYATKDEYVSELANAYVVQYAGLDAYDALTKYDSNGKEITLDDGSKVVIDWNNGYLAHSVKGVRGAVEFLNEYFYKDPTYYTYGNYVQNAQARFIAGGIGQADYVAMIAEGNWFELEAMETLKSAEPFGKGYGQVDYRMMLLPNIEGQKGIDGNGHGSVIASSEAGAITVRKQADAEKLAAIKDFIAFTLTEKALSTTTVNTGLIRGYKYSLTPAQLSAMTPFVRNCYQAYQDTANVKVLTSATDLLRSPFPYAAVGYMADVGFLPCKGVKSLLNSLKSNGDVTSVVNGVAGNYSQSTWKEFLASIKNSL